MKTKSLVFTIAVIVVAALVFSFVADETQTKT